MYASIKSKYLIVSPIRRRYLFDIAHSLLPASRPCETPGRHMFQPTKSVSLNYHTYFDLNTVNEHWTLPSQMSNWYEIVINFKTINLSLSLSLVPNSAFKNASPNAFSNRFQWLSVWFVTTLLSLGIELAVTRTNS